MNCTKINLNEFCPTISIEGLQDWTIAKNIPYFDENETDEYRRECCFLDIYYPENAAGMPVLIYFHGGGLSAGSKEDVLAENRLLNCIIVSVDYRLSPRVKTPAFIEDAAMASAWVLRNIEKYHGDPENVFIFGHSAGAYLTAMLAADKRYLNHYGAAPEDFRGYMPISGEMMTHFLVRSEMGIPDTTPRFDEYAPLSYVRKDFPPILMITGQTGIEMDCRPAENKLMRDLLVFNGNTTAYYYEIESLTHGTIWTCTGAFMRDFINRFLKK